VGAGGGVGDLVIVPAVQVGADVVLEQPVFM